MVNIGLAMQRDLDRFKTKQAKSLQKQDAINMN